MKLVIFLSKNVRNVIPTLAQKNYVDILNFNSSKADYVILSEGCHFPFSHYTKIW